MKRKQFFSGLALAALASSIFIGIAWQTKPGASTSIITTDTIPDRTKKIRNIDEVVEELDRAEIELNKAHKEFDKQKTKEELEKAMQNLQTDMARLQEDLKTAMRDVDVKKLEAEIRRSLKDVDTEKARVQAEAAIAKVDFEKIQKELSKVQQLNTEKLRKELAELEPRISKSMAEAKVQLQEATKEMKAYQTFIDDLHKDGLIDKQKDYRVEWKKGELMINGKKQGEEAIRKYTFLQGRKDFTLLKNSDEFNINLD
jgi:chromosome segregation ATPase